MREFTIIAALTLVVATHAAGQYDARPVRFQESPATLGQLDQYIARRERERQPSSFSLKKLAEDYAAGGERRDSAEKLYGFTWLLGYRIDADRDVHLIGHVDPARPPLTLDVLTTAFRAVRDRTAPECSLDPDRDPNYQRAVVRGVSRATRFAEIMLEADYAMKKMALGTMELHLKSFEPYLDSRRRMLSAFQTESARQSNRWWFSRKDLPRTILREGPNESLVLLDKNPVILMTEAEIAGKFGSGETSREASFFADSFTKLMPEIARRNRSIAELLALYRVVDIALHLDALSEAELPHSEFFWMSIEAVTMVRPITLQPLIVPFMAVKVASA